MEEKFEEALTYELYESFEQERAEWLLFSARCLARAYSDDEPEYSEEDIIQ